MQVCATSINPTGVWVLSLIVSDGHGPSDQYVCVHGAGTTQAEVEGGVQGASQVWACCSSRNLLFCASTLGWLDASAFKEHMLL